MKAILATVLVAACYSPGYKDCDVACSPSVGCPSGLMCVADRCVSSASTVCGGGSGVDGNEIKDAPDDAAFPTGPWGTPALALSLPQFPAGVSSPSLTDDQLELYFEANRDIYKVVRPSMTSAWSAPMAVIGGTTAELAPAVSYDGLQMAFTSDRAGAGRLDIYVSTRPSKASGWGAAVSDPKLMTNATESGASFTADNLGLVFDIVSSQGGSLWVTQRPSATASWGPPAQFYSPGGTVANGMLSRDKLWLFYDVTAGGVVHLAVSHRTSEADLFPPGDVISELGAADHRMPWISPDGHTLYFTAVDVDGIGAIYMATR
jgi:hypothetical protein